MPKFNISEEEWTTAERTFKRIEEEGCIRPIKLPRSNKPSNKAQMDSAGVPYDTQHSFFKLSPNMPLIATNPKTEDKFYNINHVVLGEGAFSKVKVGISKTNKVVALKIKNNNTKKINRGVSDFWVNYDLWLSHSFHYRNAHENDEKTYTLMRHCGDSIPIAIFANQAKLTDERRLVWAAKMAFQVHKLHKGWQSSRGIKYTHSDIHINNFTIDQLERIRLVDFDSACPTHLKTNSSVGASQYMPDQPWRYSNIERDIFALCRTFHFPEMAGHFNHQLVQSSALSKNNLLTESMLGYHGLRGIIDTSLECEKNRVKTSALKIACQLALASIHHERYMHLCDTDEKCYALMTLLHGEHLNFSLIENQLMDPVLVRELALIAPIAAWINPTFLHEGLTNKKKRAACITLASSPISKRYLLVESFNKTGIEPKYPSLSSLKGMIKKIELDFNFKFLINKYNLISWSVAYNEPQLLEACLLLGGDPNQADPFGYTPLMDALWQDRKECAVALLRDRAIDIKITHPNGYHAELFCRTGLLSSKECSKDFEQYLTLSEHLERSKKSSNSGEYLDRKSVLHIACQLGYYGVVEQALALNANINQQDKKGNTPLMSAILHGQLHCIESLLENEDNLDFQLENNQEVRALDLFYQKLNSNPELAIFEERIESLSLIQPPGCFCF